MNARPLPGKHACPRCHSGFLVFNATVGGDNGVCINCGFRGVIVDEMPLFSPGQPRMPREAERLRQSTPPDRDATN